MNPRSFWLNANLSIYDHISSHAFNSRFLHVAGGQAQREAHDVLSFVVWKKEVLMMKV